MEKDRFITMQCPKCGHAHANTWDNIKAHWEEPFVCEGCGLIMRVDREEALASRDRAADGGQITVVMSE